MPSKDFEPLLGAGRVGGSCTLPVGCTSHHVQLANETKKSPRLARTALATNVHQALPGPCGSQSHPLTLRTVAPTLLMGTLRPREVTGRGERAGLRPRSPDTCSQPTMGPPALPCLGQPTFPSSGLWLDEVSSSHLRTQPDPREAPPPMLPVTIPSIWITPSLQRVPGSTSQHCGS